MSSIKTRMAGPCSQGHLKWLHWTQHLHIGTQRATTTIDDIMSLAVQLSLTKKRMRPPPRSRSITEVQSTRWHLKKAKETSQRAKVSPLLTTSHTIVRTKESEHAAMWARNRLKQLHGRQQKPCWSVRKIESRKITWLPAQRTKNRQESPVSDRPSILTGIVAARAQATSVSSLNQDNLT